MKARGSSRTARRLVAYTLACSTVVAILATAVQLYSDYAVEVGAIEARVSEVEATKMRELQHALWISDRALLRLQLDGLVGLPGIAGARVVEDGREVAAAGGGPHTRTHRIPVTYVHRGETVVLGSLELDISLQSVYAQLRRRLLVILGSNAAKSLIVAGMLLLIFRRLVTRHLDTLARRFDGVGEGARAPLVLDRPPDDDDELGRVVAATNAMERRLAGHVERLAAQREEIEALNRNLVVRVHELEAFSYSLAHDLATPLRTIHSFAELLVEDCEAPDQQDLARRITRACARMDELLQGMLVLARISQDTLRVETVDLSQLARDTFESLRERAPDQDLEFEVADGLTAQGDRRLLGAAMENLLSNAWKYSAVRSPARVVVGEGRVAGREGFFVRDNGVGFDTAHAARIFAPFGRLQGEVPGTGLGLAVVRAVIDRHGGEVWVDAAPDRGATFAFTLGRPVTGSTSRSPGAVSAAPRSGA